MPEKRPAWDDVIRLWSHGRHQPTLYIYTPVIRGFRAYVGDTPMQEITLGQVQEYIDSITHNQLPSTVKRKISTLRSLFRFARKVGAIQRDVTEALLCPRVPDELAQKLLQTERTLEMIDAEPEARNKVLMILLFGCGLRASEAGHLKWADIRQRTKLDGWLSVLGKGGKRRQILLTPEIWAPLISIRPANVSSEDYVFQSQQGWKRPIERTRIAHIVRAAAQRIGLEEHVSPHWLRHGHATEAMNQGAPLALIQATLGHSSLSTTSRYLHVSPEKSSTQYVSLHKSLRKKSTKPKF